jgi:hypothetical protein
MSTAETRRRRFRVGDWVCFLYGTRKAFAQVIEDRGPLGYKGRHLYRISILNELAEPNLFEMPEEDLEPAAEPSRTAVIEFLKGGGLVSMLQANLVRGKEPPRAWLSYTSRGEITHTLVRERGVLGGAAIPYFALHEEKVFTGKKGEVLKFLEDFGLTPAEAEQVVAAVGTAP